MLRLATMSPHRLRIAEAGARQPPAAATDSTPWRFRNCGRSENHDAMRTPKGEQRMDTAFWSATRLIRALRAKKIGALELLDLYAARIARHDRALNSLCVLDLDAWSA